MQQIEEKKTIFTIFNQWTLIKKFVWVYTEKGEINSSVNGIVDNVGLK